MSIESDFEAAATRSRSLPKQGNDALLDLYGLYKQATQGDVQGERPGGFDFAGAAKYDAWASRQGMASNEAKQAYVELVNRLAAG